MSYSRWGNSRWYTFWTASSGKTKDEQYLEVMIDHDRGSNFSYKQLKGNMDSCIDEVMKKCATESKWRAIKGVNEDESTPFIYEDLIDPPSPATQDESDELRKYMKYFIADVEWQFNPIGRLSDFLIGWVWPFRNLGYWIWWNARPKRSRYYKNLENDADKGSTQEVESCIKNR